MRLIIVMTLPYISARIRCLHTIPDAPFPYFAGSLQSCGVQGDVKKLTDDVAALKPTLFVAVPRVLERIQQGIQGRLRKQSPVVQYAFQAAYAWKRFWMSWGWSAADVRPFSLDVTTDRHQSMNEEAACRHQSMKKQQTVFSQERIGQIACNYG